MLELFRLDHELTFPAVELALNEPNGLLAFGGDLSPQRLVHAYHQGIFPWFSEGEPLLWWSPDPRGIIYTQDFQASRSLKKSIRKNTFSVTMNMDFISVIQQCANIPRQKIINNQQEYANTTWITEEMIGSYLSLHQQGWAHSVEVWDEAGELAGGLYGIAINGGFCGESMFHLKTDASKAAFWALIVHMRSFGLTFIDCQMMNPHLATLGCREIPRKQFIKMWREAILKKISSDCWRQQSLRFEL
ncbi:leucyl/phenylalanyl-tRNA--protein transferase [Glaciecola sp. SC05]|uniref:leucyl/phenylalanyl-tRNA--protein transferase n=1 Tax=Glaciecola sp. SC05 TaxID=1987355 RepID=UPI0035270C71